MGPIQIHGMKYNFRTKGIAELVIEDSIPMFSSDQFGLSIRVVTTISTDGLQSLTLRAKQCRVFIRQWDKPIQVGHCDMEFVGGYRRETELAPQRNRMSMYLNVFFLKHELALLERHRDHGDLRLGLELEFVFIEDSGDDRKHGERIGIGYVDDYKIPKSDWERILRQTNYLMSESIPISELVSNDPSWSRALQTLQHARDRLNSGDGVAALDEVDQVLKQFVKFPYNGLRIRDGSGQDSWMTYLEGHFSHIEKPKMEAIAQLMSGLGGYLNKTSHHKEDLNTPTSHYEHELIVTTAQFLLTYLYRLGITERKNLSIPHESQEK